MQAGAFGFSFDKNIEDRPEDGGMLPSVVASDEEFLALAEVLSSFGVGHIGLTMGLGHTAEQRQSYRDLMRQMMIVSGRPLHVAALQDDEDVDWLHACRAEGLPVLRQQLSTIEAFEMKLSEFNLYDYMPNWVQPLVGSAEERAAKLRGPATRAAMNRDAEEIPNFRADWSGVSVLQVAHERNEKYEGMTIRELGEAMGKEPLDAFLDLAIDEGLETEFRIPNRDNPEDYSRRERILKDPYTHISLSDGGAHTRFNTNSIWPVHWLSYWVRDRELMTLEEGHYKMSAYPAWLADFKERGSLRIGDWADVMVYNQAELGYVYEKAVFANDFPGGEKRLIQKPTGLRYTIVNGAITFEGNDCTGALPGKLLRSYDMVG